MISGQDVISIISGFFSGLETMCIDQFLKVLLMQKNFSAIQQSATEQSAIQQSAIQQCST